MDERASQGETSQSKLSNTNQTQLFKHKLVLQFTLQTNFAFYSINIRLEIAEISLG